MSKKRVLTGIQPSGTLHIGNYFGAIKPMVEMQKENNMFIFIANYHAMSSLKNAQELKNNTLMAAVDFLSLGIDPNETVFWVQSDVKEVLELYWLLSGYTPMGLLERAHSYKDKVAKGIHANHALFSYPVLMAADILLYDSNIVPVGKDQIQHVEITRDIAIKFNNELEIDVLTLPTFKVEEKVATVPGIDGAKMSKSYHNTIDIFLEPKELKNRLGKIVTDSTPINEPKDYTKCNIFAIASLFLDQNGQEELTQRYKDAKEGYGHFKMYLQELIWNHFEPARKKREYYLSHIDEVKDILDHGAKKAAQIAKEKMDFIRQNIGIYR